MQCQSRMQPRPCFSISVDHKDDGYGSTAPNIQYMMLLFACVGESNLAKRAANHFTRTGWICFPGLHPNKSQPVMRTVVCLISGFGSVSCDHRSHAWNWSACPSFLQSITWSGSAYELPQAVSGLPGINIGKL